MTALSLARIAEALGGKVSDGQVSAPGPGHSAADRSLSVKLDDAAPEGFVVNSFAEDNPVVCRDYVRQKLGLPEFKSKKGNSKAAADDWKLVREHIYQTADGAPHIRKQKKIDPKGEKQFPQAHWIDGKWVNKVPKDWPRILYRLPELLKAPQNSIAYITEGEGDSDALAALGFVATTAGGVSETKPWTKPEFVEPLKGRRVIIVVDSDRPGREYGERVARALDKVADSLKVVDLFPEDKAEKNGRDVSDFLKSDRAGAKFAKMVKDAEAWEPGPETEVGKESASDDDGVIAELATLPPLEYDRRREKEAENLKVRVTTLDKLVATARGESIDDGRQGRAVSFPDIDPWPEAVDGVALLAALAGAIGDHVVMSDQCRDIATLWTVHTFLLDHCFISPRLAVCSPTKQCGKTTFLDLLSFLVLRPLSTANVSPAAVFRTVEAYRPCLLVDEGDTFLNEREELRGILNSGHRRGGCVLRTVGEEHEPRAFATYAACAIALIGKLPDTLADRSVTITLKRRLRSEPITPLRLDRTDHLHALSRQIARWTHDHAHAIAAADPAMPDGVHNRAADNWRPLLAIADVAGGEWPKRARAAAKVDCETADSKSRLEQLINDIQKVWAAQTVDRLSSAGLIGGLVGLPESSWAEYGKSRKPVSQAQLARLLKPLGVVPQVVRIGDETARGYFLSQFDEAFQRYGSHASSTGEGVSNRNSETNPDETGTSDLFQGVTREGDVTGRKSKKSNNDGLCCGVTVQKGESGEEGLTPRGDSGAGLPQHVIRRLAGRHEDSAADQYHATGDVDRPALDAELRRILAEEEGVFPEHVEVEFERIMKEMFRAK